MEERTDDELLVAQLFEQDGCYHGKLEVPDIPLSGICNSHQKSKRLMGERFNEQHKSSPFG